MANTPRPRSIDEALADAGVFQGDYTSSQLDASRARLIHDLTESRWSQALGSPPAPSTPCRPAALPEQAAHQLWALSRNVITDSEAAEYIARFDDVRDPGGALAFACLLDLADMEDGAQFWWQFAAGAGNPTSALCLYLMHLRRGEMRDARHWAGQIGVLEEESSAGEYQPVPYAKTDPTAPGAGITIRYEARTADDDVAVSDEALRGTVDQLDVGRHEEIGPIPTPSAELAKQVEDLVSH